VPVLGVFVTDAKTIAMSETPDSDLTLSLRHARIAESAHFEAVMDIRDAKTLRLQVLKDDLVPIVASNREAGRFFDLALVPGEPPRLWIDLITGVIMEPDPRTYRLIQDTQSGREVLVETSNRGELVDRIKLHMAHQLVARERKMAVAPANRMPIQGHSSAAVILAWLSGFSIGVLALFMIGLMLDKARW